MLLRADRWALLLGLAVLMDGSPAHGQANLSAGKSPAQIFSTSCSACHRSPQTVKRTSPAFLREHYTTGTREAIAMAGYLASVRAELQRRAAEAGTASGPVPPVPPVPGVPGLADQTGAEIQTA